MKRVMVLAVLSMLNATGWTKADVIVSNLTQVTAGQDELTITNAAQKFTMGGNAELLSDVQLLLHNNGGSLSNVAIFSDSGGQPGGSLLDLGPIVPNLTGDAVYQLTPGGSFTLAANTTYWVEVSYSGTPVWDFTDSDAWTGSGTLGDGNGVFAGSTDNGANWTVLTGAPYQIQVDGSPAGVPEPSSLMLLTLTASGVALTAWRRRKKKAAIESQEVAPRSLPVLPSSGARSALFPIARLAFSGGTPG